MKIYVLFAQRKEQYPGQLGPELWAAIDEYGNDDNPGYIKNELTKAKKQSDIINAKIFEIDLGPHSIQFIKDKLLLEAIPKLDGDIQDV
jgi:hypothetical protein